MTFPEPPPYLPIPTWLAPSLPSGMVQLKLQCLPAPSTPTPHESPHLFFSTALIITSFHLFICLSSLK